MYLNKLKIVAKQAKANKDIVKKNSIVNVGWAEA